MRLLLDTQAFLWFEMDSARLSATAKGLIEDRENDRFLSIASAWEMAIKVSLGKLKLPQPVGQFVRTELRKNAISLLPIDLKHLDRAAALPFHHRDPFDRLIIAQALAVGLAVVSSDTFLDAYGVQRLW